MSRAIAGKTVSFLDREHGFVRFGVVRKVGRVRGESRVTKTGRRVKKPTVSGFVVEIPGGKRMKVRQDDVRAVVWYGKEVPFEEFVKEGEE